MFTNPQLQMKHYQLRQSLYEKQQQLNQLRLDQSANVGIISYLQHSHTLQLQEHYFYCSQVYKLPQTVTQNILNLNQFSLIQKIQTIQDFLQDQERQKLALESDIKKLNEELQSQYNESNNVQIADQAYEPTSWMGPNTSRTVEVVEIKELTNINETDSSALEVKKLTNTDENDSSAEENDVNDPMEICGQAIPTIKIDTPSDDAQKDEPNKPSENHKKFTLSGTGSESPHNAGAFVVGTDQEQNANNDSTFNKRKGSAIGEHTRKKAAINLNRLFARAKAQPAAPPSSPYIPRPSD